MTLEIEPSSLIHTSIVFTGIFKCGYKSAIRKFQSYIEITKITSKKVLDNYNFVSSLPLWD